MNSSQRKSTKQGKSVILHALHRFSAWLYALILNSFIGRFLTNYHHTESVVSETRWYRLTHSRRKRADRSTFRFRQWISRLFEQSLVCRAVGVMEHALLRTAINCYGIFFLFFGCYCVVTYYVLGSLSGQEISLSYPITGGAMLLVSLPMFASNRSLAHTLRRSTVFRSLIVGVFGIAEERLACYGEGGREHYLEALILAVLGGTLTFICPPTTLLVIALITVAVLLILREPEVGMMISIGLAPFLALTGRPTLLLLIFVGVTLLSYAVKLLCGKRVLHMQAADWLVLALLALTLLGGLITHGGRASLYSALAYVCLGLMYFVVVGLVRSQKGVWRVMLVLLFSCVTVALLGIGQYIFSRPALQYVDLSLFSDLGGRVTALWGNPNILAEHLILLLPLALTALILQRRLLRGFGSALCVAAIALCLILTWSRGAWLGCLIAVLLYVLCLNHRALSWVIVGTLPALALVPFAPDTVLRRFASITSQTDSSIVYRLNLWKGIGDMLSKHGLSGVGVGENAFCAVYTDYALPGIETAMHSHSLYLQLLCETGVMGLIVFCLAMALWLQHALAWLRYGQMRSARLVVLGGLAGIAALLIMGAFDHIWYNYRIYMLFWTVAGLVTAQIRVGDNDTERAANRVDDERTQGEIVLHFH